MVDLCIGTQQEQTAVPKEHTMEHSDDFRRSAGLCREGAS